MSDLPAVTPSVNGESANRPAEPQANSGSDTMPAPESAPLQTEAASMSARAGELGRAEQRKLDPRFIPCERIAWWILTAIVVLCTFASLIVALLMAWPGELTRWLLVPAWFAISGLFVWLAIRVPEAVYRRTSYAVTSGGLEIHRGLLWRGVITVPKSRVQHTDVMQGPLQRRYGLATLTVHTAGTDHAAVQLSGLSHADAIVARDLLLSGGRDDGV